MRCLICIILRFCAALIYIDILLLDEKIFQTIGDSHSWLTTTKRSIFFPLLLRQRSGGSLPVWAAYNWRNIKEPLPPCFFSSNKSARTKQNKNRQINFWLLKCKKKKNTGWCGLFFYANDTKKKLDKYTTDKKKMIRKSFAKYTNSRLFLTAMFSHSI